MNAPLTIRPRNYCPACGSLQIKKTKCGVYLCSNCHWSGLRVITLPTVHKAGKAIHGCITTYSEAEGVFKNKEQRRKLKHE
jgi:ribosomal protein L37AE/L43A